MSSRFCSRISLHFTCSTAFNLSVGTTCCCHRLPVENTDFTLDTTTGRVTFDSAPYYGADVTWTGEFDLPVRFDRDELDYEITTVNVISFPQLQIVELKQ